jgi:transcription termination factor Rho
MSNQNNEETPPQIPAGTDDAAPARKRAAKKTTAKKAVAKKATARKAAKKIAEPAAAPEPPAIQTIIEPAPARKTSRARKSADEPQPLPSETPALESVAPQEGKRFGRVPGGGPRVPREAPTTGETPPPPAAREFNERPPQEGAQGTFQNRDSQNRDGQPRESRSKRRREKRKRRGDRQGQQHGGNRPEQGGSRPEQGGDFQGGDPNDRRPQPLSGPKIEADGMLELAPKGFGFLRIPGKNFEQARDDVFVTPETIRKYHLRLGQWVHGLYQNGPRGPQIVEVVSINGMTPEEASKLPHFDELKAVNPTKRISFETTPERFTTRVVDIMAPVGRGQRGLIVSPPRSGKTTLLLHMAEAIREKYDEAIHLMVLLVDERPEEVTEFRRALPGAEIYASSNDEQARNHCRIAELAIERAKRLVEAGKDVFLLMDSITRLARAYNNTMGNRGRGTGSGGITIGALEVPRRLFAAARNTRGGGSLTIMATALIQTNSRADEAIFMEFKGTGNMELVLDRKIAENYIYPAVDIFKSGTRREELLIPDHMLHKIHLIRRGLSGHRPVEAMERLLFFLKKFPNNPQMLLEIKG